MESYRRLGYESAPDAFDRANRSAGAVSGVGDFPRVADWIAAPRALGSKGQRYAVFLPLKFRKAPVPRQP